MYGSVQAPLHLIEEGTTETAPESDGKGISINLESIVGCDFPPKKLATSVTIAAATLPVYPTQVTGVTP